MVWRVGELFWDGWMVNARRMSCGKYSILYSLLPSPFSDLSTPHSLSAPSGSTHSIVSINHKSSIPALRTGNMYRNAPDQITLALPLFRLLPIFVTRQRHPFFLHSRFHHSPSPYPSPLSFSPPLHTQDPHKQKRKTTRAKTKQKNVNRITQPHPLPFPLQTHPTNLEHTHQRR